MNKALGLLGLLNRGGKTLIGSAIPGSLKGVKALIVANDASGNSVADLLDRAEYLSIPTLKGLSKVELGESLGFAQLSAVAITDAKAAKALASAWKETI